MKYVLSISGGGMRGLIPAVLMAEIEYRTSIPAAYFFSLIGGTSTGGILACLAGAGVDAAEASEFYWKHGPHIFKQSAFRSISTLGGVLRPRYSGDLLAEELQKSIGTQLCREAKTKLLIPTLDADEVDAVFIKSWDDFWLEFPMWSAAAATSSAQTYFPAFKCRHNGKDYRFLDGGNHSNNPTASVVFEAKRLWPDEEIIAIHLGTGRQANPAPLPDGGMARWAPLVFDTLSECQDDVARYFTSRVDGVTVHSFDVTFDKNPALDDSSVKTLTLLNSAARRSITQNSKRLDTALSL